MTELIISSLISGLCVGIPSIIATIVTNKSSAKVMLFRIEELEKKQDKHNSVIERLYKVEEKVKDIEKEVDYLRK